MRERACDTIASRMKSPPEQIRSSNAPDRARHVHASLVSQDTSGAPTGVPSAQTEAIPWSDKGGIKVQKRGADNFPNKATSPGRRAGRHGKEV